VVLIGVDTLRPDHLTCYGYERNTSPAIDKLAAEGVLFENVVSQSPWTTPSFATVFTSLYPTQHGAGSLESRMRTESTSMAEVFRERGYATGAIVNAPALSPQFGLGRGFDQYDISFQREGRRASEVTKAALAWIDLNRDRPFLLFAHYFDPHLSYAPPAPYDTIFDPDYRGRLGNSFSLEEFPRAKVTNFSTMKVLTAADWNHIRSLYDGEILYMDTAVADLLQGLRNRGLYDRTLIVFLSDHGEEFFEHQGFSHGHTLFDELIRVPLILSMPERLPQGARVTHQVRLLDVMPTVLDLAGHTPNCHMEGTSLRALMTGGGELKASKASLLPQAIALAEALLHGPERKSITAYPWKLVYDTVTGDEMLFNLEVDPGEYDDLIGREEEPRRSLEESLFGALFGVSDTWYVEVSGGNEGHTFDMAVRSESRGEPRSIELYRFLDSDGRIVEVGDQATVEVGRDMLNVEGLNLKGLMRLALKPGSDRTPLSFDFRIDGRPTLDRIFLGESLTRPEKMPFVQRSWRGKLSLGEPSRRPEPPYILVWHRGSKYKSQNRIELDEETKKEFRALGYIQ
jgi:arylsulfatase A-like enzyme